MPLYEYVCPECEQVDEVLVSGPKDAVECEYCKGLGLDIEMERQMAAPAAHFKGQGFHCNDYRFKDDPMWDKSIAKAEKR